MTDTDLQQILSAITDRIALHTAMLDDNKNAGVEYLNELIIRRAEARCILEVVRDVVGEHE